MFKKEIWDILTEFTFFEILKDFKISKMNKVDFPQISRINMPFLVNHM